MIKKLQAAVEEFEKRQSRARHPEGRCDNGGRWYPSADERCECCASLRSPSRSYPWSLMLHCRTAEHVGHLYGVSGSEIRRVVREKQNSARKIENNTPKTFFKSVAWVNGALLSLYDGSDYALGVTRRERAVSKHRGGFYVREDAVAAMISPLPDDAIFADAPRVVVECECTGPYHDYDGKIAVTAITPKRIVLGLAAVI